MVKSTMKFSGRRDGIGRRAGFKIPWWQHRMGSTPIAGTIDIKSISTNREGIMNNTYIQIIILVVFIAIMYFLLIRPQKKKEQEINKMRSSIAVGDQIVTIGGICGKVIKTKDDTLIIQVGADKTKMEMKRWAVSTIEKKSDKAPEKFEDEEVRKTKPKRLGKKEPQSMQEELARTAIDSAEAPTPAEPVSEAAEIEKDIEASQEAASQDI